MAILRAKSHRIMSFGLYHSTRLLIPSSTAAVPVPVAVDIASSLRLPRRAIPYSLSLSSLSGRLPSRRCFSLGVEMGEESISYLSQKQAAEIDEILMGPLGFSVDQLMVRSPFCNSKIKVRCVFSISLWP